MAERLVSVYINAYNSENCISETVNSILTQTYKNLKVIVVDNFSDDNTVGVLKSINDDRLKVYSLKENPRIASALNDDIRPEESGYTVYCDADEIWAPDRLEQQIKQLEKELSKRIVSLQNAVSEDDEKICELTMKNANLEAIIDAQAHELTEFKNSFFWRLTKPPRAIIQALKDYARKHKRLLFVLIVIKSFLCGGPKAVKQKMVDIKVLTAPKIKIPHTISDERRAKEESVKFSKDIKISILVPLYNTPQIYLREMIESVQNQTYKNWELCLADGSTNEFSYIEQFCKSVAENDDRIKYMKLAENKGISENTNVCLSMATGEYIALFDHDDYLHPSALFEVMKRIEDGADYIYTDEATFLDDNFDKIIVCHCKPDYAFDNLVANNYICHFSVFKSTLVTSDKLFRTKYDGSQDHDLILRLTDSAEKIMHIPQILYFWRSHKNSVAMDINSKTYAIEAGRNAVRDFLYSKGLPCTVTSSPAFPTIYKIKYEIKGEPKVSIIIPNKDHYSDLVRCIDSVKTASTYKNYGIIIVDNGTTDEKTLNYYETLKGENNVKILSYDMPFNFSAMNNLAAKNADGDYLLFLNNDTKVLSPDWMEELIMYAQREDVGAVGAKLLYKNKTVQHAGIVLGLGVDRVAGHAHNGCGFDNVGYMGKLFYAQDVSAVTAACMMVKKDIFESVGGFNEELAVAYNDVDFCLRLREQNKLIIMNPFCTLYHYESVSRGLDTKTKHSGRFLDEKIMFMKKWGDTIRAGDPYYNPNLSLDSSYEVNPKL